MQYEDFEIQIETRAENQHTVSELITLCFDLNIDYENLPGQGKASKARELVGYLKRHRRMADLIVVGQAARPELPWLSAPPPG